MLFGQYEVFTLLLLLIVLDRRHFLALKLIIDWRWTAQSGQRNRVILDRVRIDVRLLSHDRWTTSVDLDKLAPYFLLHRLVIEFDHKFLSDRRCLRTLGIFVTIGSRV